MLPLSKSIEAKCWAQRMTYDEYLVYLAKNKHSLKLGPRLDDEAYTELMNLMEKFYQRACATL